MKLSFSTLGCPKWHWSEILAAAHDLGYDGIEMRGLGDVLFLPKIPVFSPSMIENTSEQLTRLGLSISCLTSDIVLSEDDSGYLASCLRYIALSHDLNTPYIRVLGDRDPWPSSCVDERLVYSRLCKLAPAAESLGAVLLIETNGVFADSSRLSKLISDVGSKSVRVLWDINHPFRYFGEAPETTFENIGEYVCHVHVKDSVIADGKQRYKMLGYGDLPLKKCFSLLKSNNYGDFISLEWTKRWNKDLEDPGIVFSHFVHAAKDIWESV